MRIHGKSICFTKIVALFLYYGFAQYLPESHSILGKVVFSERIRYFLCKILFKKIGKNVNIERKACFGSGLDIEIGDNSGLGINCNIPSNTIIGADVMMGPNCYILPHNDSFKSTDIPMILQGNTQKLQTIIENDVWIGRNVTMTPGRKIQKGTIIGACCLLCKDFPAYSIVGGNPSNLIRNRLN